jgi:hypothetical protein
MVFLGFNAKQRFLARQRASAVAAQKKFKHRFLAVAAQ